MPTTTTSIRRTPALLPDAIRARRTAIGLSRIDLANRAGVSFAHLSNIEAGAVPKRGDAVRRILAALEEAERA